MKKTIATFSVAVSVLLMPVAAYSDTASVTARVTKILSSETNFGGCMLELTVSPQSVLPACNPNWVTLSCDGTHLSRDAARRLLDQGQISYALGRAVQVYIDDSRRINGYCQSFRIDLVGNP